MKENLWGAIVLLILLPSLVLAEGKPQVDAQEEFKKGVKLFRLGQFEQAIPHFQRSDVLVPHPDALFNQCRCYQELDQRDRAVECFNRFVEVHPTDDDVGRAKAYVNRYSAKTTHPPTSAPTRPTCQLILGNIPADVQVKLNGKVVSDPTKPIITDCLQQVVVLIRGGKQIDGGRITTTTPDKPARWEYAPTFPPIVDAKKATPPAATQSFTAVDQVPPADNGWRDTLGYSALGVGGAAIITSGVLGYMMSDSIAQQESCQGNQDCTRSELNSFNDEAKGRQTGMIVAGTVGIAAAGAGLYLLLTDETKSPNTQPAPGTVTATPNGFIIRW